MRHVTFALLVLLLGGMLWFGCGDDDSSPATHNRAPVIASLTLTPDTVQVADTVLVSVVASDEDGDSLVFAYAPTGGTLLGSGPIVRWVPIATTGVHVLAAVVTDGQGGTDTAEDSVLICNTAPIIVSIAVDPDTIRVGLTADVVVTAFDADDDELAYSYEASGGSITGSGPAVSWQAPHAAGTYSLSVLVSDGHTGDAQGTATLVVVTNRDPVVNSVTVTPSSVPAGGIATVSVNASDPDGDALTYSYVVTGGAITGNGATATWTAPSISGAHTLTVTVSDGAATAQGMAVLTVQASQTGIRGTISAPPGPAVDLRNTLVRLYASYDDYYYIEPMFVVAAHGNEFQVNFQFVGLAPGTYWLDAWKDADASGSYTANDIWAVFATGSWGSLNVLPIMVTQGSVTRHCTSGLLAVHPVAASSAESKDSAVPGPQSPVASGRGWHPVTQQHTVGRGPDHDRSGNPRGDSRQLLRPGAFRGRRSHDAVHEPGRDRPLQGWRGPARPIAARLPQRALAGDHEGGPARPGGGRGGAPDHRRREAPDLHAGCEEPRRSLARLFRTIRPARAARVVHIDGAGRGAGRSDGPGGRFRRNRRVTRQ